MKKTSFFLLVFAVCTGVTAQEIPNTVRIKELFNTHRVNVNPVILNPNPDLRKQPIETKEELPVYNKITVTLISEHCKDPIQYGTIYSEPVAKKISKDITDNQGIGILELVPGTYRIYGEATGYQKRHVEIGPRDHQLVIVLVLLYKLESQIKALIDLIEKNEIEAAKTYLEKIKLSYPDNPDVNYVAKKYNLN